LELPGGIVTPGWFDLRPHVARLPWPDVRGRRCLDVGTYDGFYAFELERRGASEVVALDLADHTSWDWPLAARSRGPEGLAELAGEKGAGFLAAREALGSSVDRRQLSVYELSPERVGSFDVVVCGSLLLHLRDPVRALEAIRSVCHGWFLSIEEVSLYLSARSPRRPAAEMRFSESLCQWWVVNLAGHRRMLEIAGFAPTRHFGPYQERYGEAHPAYQDAGGRPRPWRRGVLHAAWLAERRDHGTQL
jgi:tRNA (mo5U34)-methyltransferase